MKKICLLLIITLLLGFMSACQNPAGSNQTTEPLPIENEDGTLAQWMKDEITQAYVNNGYSIRDVYWAEDSNNEERTYLGTENGYVILFSVGGPDAWWSIQIGEYVFEYSCYFYLKAYKDGEFFLLKDVYEQGLISDAAIKAAWEIHRNYNN